MQRFTLEALESCLMDHNPPAVYQQLQCEAAKLVEAASVGASPTEAMVSGWPRLQFLVEQAHGFPTKWWNDSVQPALKKLQAFQTDCPDSHSVHVVHNPPSSAQDLWKLLMQKLPTGASVSSSHLCIVVQQLPSRPYVVISFHKLKTPEC